MLTRNCYIMGFMGAGKSYIAKRLADYTTLPVVDLDSWIEEEAGKAISHIFEEEGETYFRELEQKMLYKTLELAPSLVALGGGTPVYKNNMDWILENGATVFLDPPVSILVRRLEKERAKRPLLAEVSTEELREVIEERLEARRPVYERANLCVHTAVEDITIDACLTYFQMQ